MIKLTVLLLVGFGALLGCKPVPTVTPPGCEIWTDGSGHYEAVISNQWHYVNDRYFDTKQEAINRAWRDWNRHNGWTGFDQTYDTHPDVPGK